MSQINEILKNVSSPVRDELIEYIETKIESVNHINSIKVSLNIFKMAVEIVAVKKAYIILTSLIGDFRQYSPRVDKPKDPKDSFKV